MRLIPALEKSGLFIAAVAVNLGLYLLVPWIQVLAARHAAKPHGGPQTVTADLVFEPPTRDRLEKREIKPIKTVEYHPPSTATTRPSTPGGGLKIDLSPAGGEGQGLLSGGDLSGQIGSGSGYGKGAGMAAMTYEPGQTDVDAKPIGDPPLNCPPRAQREGISGFADLSFVVDESGFVEDIQVLKEEPTGYGFAANAIESARKMRFKPAMLQKMAVRQTFKRRFSCDVQ